MSNIAPLADHVIVESLVEQHTTKAGIVLPETAKEKPQRGKVIAVGPGRMLENGQQVPIDVNVGDIVYFTKYSPDEIEMTIDGEKTTLLVIKSSSLLAKEQA